MSRTKRSSTPAALAALGALVAALLVVVGGGGTASALPAGCTTTFTGTANWSSAGNWSGGVPTASSVACIQGGASATLSSGTVHVAQLHVDGALVVTGASLFVDAAGPSVWDGPVDVDQATIGGTGTIHVHASLTFTGDSALSSVPGGPGTAWTGQHGTMNVAGAATPQGLGTVTVEDGLSLRASYNVGLFGTLRVESQGFVTADWGTATAIAGGRMELNGAGGYYQGSPVAGAGVGTLHNDGTLAKTGGGTTSVVDAAYSQSAGATVQVDCCATLAFAGGQVVSGRVQADQSLGTGACGAGTTSICAGSTNPAVDPTAVTLKIPASNPQTAAVQLQELPVPPLTQDSKRIGQEIYAHADQLTPDAANPATITLRLADPEVMATPITHVQVAHTDDAGHQTQLPDCVSGALPPGATSCVVRPVERTSEFTRVTVKTVETSRWHLRRNAPGEPGDQTPPSAPQALAAAPVGGGASVRLVWAAPANDGGAAVSAYRVLVDGKQVAVTTGLSASLANLGAGPHTLEVAAVNVIGTSARSAVALTLKKISAPRKAVAVKGKRGGKLTAGVRWKAPASVGGLALTAYQVVVVDKRGKVVAKKKVAPAKLRTVLRFKSTGKVRLKVRARNLDRYGPFSTWTDWVRPR